MKISTILATTTLLAFAAPAFAEEKTLTIGLSDALSGGGAVYGMPQKRAIDLAIEQINAAGGVKVGEDTYKLATIEYDDKGDPTEASNVARKLIDRDGVKYLVGYCCSASAGAVASIMGREDAIMLVGTAGARAITAQGADNVFRTRPPGDYTGAAAGRFIAEQGVKTLGVITTRDVALFTQYRDSMIEAFEAAGGKVVGQETFGGQDRDMSSQLTTLRGLNPDAYFISGYVEQAAFSHRQAHELGITAPRYGFSGGSAEQFLKVASADAMNGAWDLLAVEFSESALGEEAKEYAKAYQTKWNEYPTPNSAFAYDQIYVLKDALEAAGDVDDLDAVKEALRNLSVPDEAILNYLPIDGKMFDPKGQAYISNGAFQFENDAWVFKGELPSDAAAYSNFLAGVSN